MTTTGLKEGASIRVCHKTARVQTIDRENESVKVSLEVGGVAGNTLVVTEEYARTHLVDS